MEKHKKGEVSLSSFSYLFAQLINYYLKRDDSNVETNLKRVGGEIGFRLFNIMTYREKILERETRLLPMLRLVQANVFKYIFGKEAEKVAAYKHPSIEDKRLFVIRDNAPIILKCIPENDQLLCSVFVAGMIEAILCAAGFKCQVSAETVVDEENKSRYPETQYLVTFSDEVEKKYRME